MTTRTTSTTPAETPAALPAASPLPFEQAIAQVIESGQIPMEDFKGIPLVLFKDHVEVTLDKGVKRQISYPGLKELIDRSINVKEVVSEVEGMMLPSNVFFISQSARELRFNCYYPGGNKDMLFEERKMNIAIPNIIIAYTLQKDSKDWIVKNSIYMCTDLPISKLPKSFIAGPDKTKGIYLLPMSNTYDGGNMCFGGNQMPARFKDNQFRGLDWYYRFLWETPFNSDLGIKAIGGATSPSNWYSTLAKVAKDGKVFPYRDLSGWREMEGAIPSESALGRR